VVSQQSLGQVVWLSPISHMRLPQCASSEPEPEPDPWPEPKPDPWPEPDPDPVPLPFGSAQSAGQFRVSSPGSHVPSPHRFGNGRGTGKLADNAVHANGSAHSQQPPRMLGSSRPVHLGRVRVQRSGEPSSHACGMPSGAHPCSSAHVQQPSRTASVLPAGHHGGGSLAHVRGPSSSHTPVSPRS
jgi:hypothetical protein